MTELAEERHLIRDLAETLAVEYGGALPPGQVLAVVFRSNHALGSHLGLSLPQRLQTCEDIARRQLTARLAEMRPEVDVRPITSPRRSAARRAALCA